MGYPKLRLGYVLTRSRAPLPPVPIKFASFRSRGHHSSPSISMPAPSRFLLCLLLLSASYVAARHARSTTGVAEAIQPDQPDTPHDLEPRQAGAQPDSDEAAAHRRKSLITFSDPRAAEFLVDGTKIPEGGCRCSDDTVVWLCSLSCFADQQCWAACSDVGRGPVVGGLDADLRRRERNAQAVLLVCTLSFCGFGVQEDNLIV